MVSEQWSIRTKFKFEQLKPRGSMRPQTRAAAIVITYADGAVGKEKALRARAGHRRIERSECMAAQQSPRDGLWRVPWLDPKSPDSRTGISLRHTHGKSLRGLASEQGQRGAAQFPFVSAAQAARVAAWSSAIPHVRVFYLRGVFFSETVAYAGSRGASSGARNCSGGHSSSFCIRDYRHTGASAPAQIRRRPKHSAFVEAA